MNPKLEKALQHLLDNAINTSKPKAAGAKVLRYATSGEYKINDIRIIAVNASIEYKTWTVEIAVKKDDEHTNQMKRFKLSISVDEVPMWQKIQMEYMNSFKVNFDFDDEVLPGTNPNNDGSDNSSESIAIEVAESIAEKPVTTIGSDVCSGCGNAKGFFCTCK